SVTAGGVPVRIRDVATVQFGPEIRRGAADFNGIGEAVGGIVVMRIDSNALDVINQTKIQIQRLNLPEGVRLVPTYDRSELIQGSIDTLVSTLIKEVLIIILISLVFLLHFRSALIATTILLLSVLFSFIAIRHLGLTTNIMSLGGIAIALVELADAAIVLIENAHVRLARAKPEEDRKEIIIGACQEVGRPIFWSLVLMMVSFLPIFTLAGQAGRLFDPLAYTKTVAIIAAAVLTITLAPVLMTHLMRGKFHAAEKNPVNRMIMAMYRPMVRLMVRWRWGVVLVTVVVMLITVPVFRGLGSEFMPPLDEGSLLVMPTTLPGISIEEARRALGAQHRIIKSFEEVAMVHGKAGRAETATDPAQLDMIESVVLLRPREEWPLRPSPRWYSGWAPDWLASGLARVWPLTRRRTTDELATALEEALRMPGYQMAIAPPIRTRIDMLTTGVRTPVGVKVFGDDLLEIEAIAIELEGLLREVPGTRSTFAERQSGLEYIDIVPDREMIARYGLSVRDVHDVVEAAIGGMGVSTAIIGRSRFDISVRYGQDFRADLQSLRDIPVSVPTTEPVSEFAAQIMGAGTSPPTGEMGPMGLGAMGAMGGMAQMGEMSGTGGGAVPEAMGMVGGSGGASGDAAGRRRPLSSTVPLGLLADIRVVTGPPMIKNEDGVLVGYVFIDIDTAERDLGSWVEDARRLTAERLAIPHGYALEWTGQYEFMAEMEARLRYVIPLTVLLIIVLLFLSMRGWPQTFLVFLSLPFSLAGSVVLLSLLDYNLSTAVWVGLIAVGGVAAQVGIIMVVYLDQAYEEALNAGVIELPDDVDGPIIEAATQRARPVIMTSATTVLGLLPLLWESGVGADVSARTAAPVVGGMISCMVLTLLVLPAVYALWRRHDVGKHAKVPGAGNG
ncbi:MAG: efflux RND transporter permease subunit, partial [Bradymonadaceae bacterium]